MNKLTQLCSINVLQFIYYNYFCKKILRNKGCWLIPYKYSRISLGKDAKIELHGNFFVNAHKIKHSKAEAYVYLRNHASLTIGPGNTILVYLSTIEIHDHAVVTIGGAYINVGSVILSENQISIGKDVLISRQTFIYDTDAHKILDDQGEQTNASRPVQIGDHVWIGVKSTILRGSKIADGAVLAAGSVVMGRVKHHCLAMGYPAREISLIEWEK